MSIDAHVMCNRHVAPPPPTPPACIQTFFNFLLVTSGTSLYSADLFAQWVLLEQLCVYFVFLSHIQKPHYID